MDAFYRGGFHDLVITLSSNKPLGIFSSGYLQNYSGLDGYITLRDQTGVAHDMPMAEVALSAEPAPHEVFTGSLPLSTLPDGNYSVQCRVRDPYGNYTVVGAVASPIGTETVESITFSIVEGVLYMPSVALIPTGEPASLSASGPGITFSAAIVQRTLSATAPQHDVASAPSAGVSAQPSDPTLQSPNPNPVR